MERTDVKFPITPYGIASFVCFALLYSVYFVGIHPASLEADSRLFAVASFWLHFMVLFLLAAVLAHAVRLGSHRRPAVGQWLVGSLGVLLTLWMFVDGKVFNLFQLHINRFFIEALLQKDAVAQIGASPTALLASTWPLALLLLPHIFVRPLSAHAFLAIGRRGMIAITLVLATLVGADKAAYGYFYFKGAPFVFDIKNAAPVYPTPHPYHIAKVFEPILGKSSRVSFMEQLGERVDMSADARGRFNYPPIAPESTRFERPLNIILVVAESLRADDFNAETAPFLSELAQSAIHATRHYSSSNSTHLGFFSLFYGLNPHYFHDARLGRVPSAPIELLALSDYEIHQTISFSMEWYDLEHFVYGGRHETYLADAPDVVTRDRAVTDRSINLAREAHERGTPYFNFVYYYAPHADYSSPPEAQVFQPALPAPVNFADPRLRDNREALLNRYRNSIRFIDTEMARMVEGLKSAGVWDDTILIFTSDHGEEFFEEGRYGHNSSLNRYQTKVPFLMHIPGLDPQRIDRLTSHTDVIGTLLTVLGAPHSFLANTQGHDMLVENERPIYIGNAHFQRPERYAIRDGDRKIEVDLKGGTVRLHAATGRDAPKTNRSENTEMQVLRLLQQFREYRD